MKLSINEQSSLEEIGALVCDSLSKAGIEVVLTGGAVVSIYSANEFMSYDLDFIVLGIGKKVDAVMISLGFTKNSGRHFVHPLSKFYVEFPGGTLNIGESLETEIVERKSNYGTLKLLSPTDCVKDRLAAFYHWNDPQGLEQAIAVAKKHPVSIHKVKQWSLAEGAKDKFELFHKRLLAKTKE